MGKLGDGTTWDLGIEVAGALEGMMKASADWDRIIGWPYHHGGQTCGCFRRRSNAKTVLPQF